MDRTDPVEHVDRDADVHEVTGWSPRSPIDWLAVAIHALLTTGTKWAIVGGGVIVTLIVAVWTPLDLVLDPFVTSLVLLSVVPALVLAAYVRWIDVTTREPLTVLTATFLLAVFTAVFAGFFNEIGQLIVTRLAAPLGEFVALALFFFLVVGPVEEAIKLLAVRLYAYNHERFDAVIDGAVYGAVAGLGFATIENALYITDVVDDVGVATVTAGEIQEITGARALAGPGHVLYSAIAGYYLGLAKYTPDRWGPIVIKGLLVAALFHALYNTTVGIGAGLIAALTPAPAFVAVLAYIVCFQLVVGYYLYRKLDRYRRAYRSRDAGRDGGDLASERTEFEPGHER